MSKFFSKVVLIRTSSTELTNPSSVVLEAAGVLARPDLEDPEQEHAGSGVVW